MPLGLAAGINTNRIDVVSLPLWGVGVFGSGAAGERGAGDVGRFGRGKSRLEAGATKTKGDEGGVGSGGGR